MKNKIKLLLLSVLFLGLTLGVYAIVRKIQTKSRIEKIILQMPLFQLTKIGETGNISSAILKPYHRKYILFFNSECEHCQYELESIKKNIKRFPEAKFLFISAEPPIVLTPFYKQQHFNEFPFYLASDSDFVVKNTFGAHSFPTTYIYDNNNQLLKKITGEAKIDLLINAR